MPTGPRRRVIAGLIALVLTALTLAMVPPSSSADDVPEEVPGTRPSGGAARSALTAATAEDASDGLQMVVNERGRISQSTSAVGTNSSTGSLRVRKPAGAEVRGAWMAYATRGFSGYQVQAPLVLAGQPVPVTNELLNGIESYNYFADVTDIVKPVVDAAATGDVLISVKEPDPYYIEGEILVVVFDDPSVEQDQSVTLLYGALAPGGDSYRVALSEPIDLSDPATRLEMSLGISFSYQRFGTQQYSYVDVNGRPLTTAAGGEDDGQPSNGALMTVGGLGDSTDNPPDPEALPTHARSDDELYDLQPFVANGDRRIQVTTKNPSEDDNVMLATFTMNPPVTKIDSDKRDVVMVSLGDSYQSGEGAGNSIDDTAEYYTFAYENGENFPQAVGGQEDTLTPEVSSVGNGCHRAMRNYPKLVADYLTDDADVTLVDVTCSGAQVQWGSKPPIVGNVDSGGIDPESQVAQALVRLGSVGLSNEDVGVVTVGMGGNDAKFGELVMACLIPTLSRELLGRYENTPKSISWLANRLSCKRLDDWKFHVGDAIDALAAKERFAQRQLREVFPNADIVQVNYPGILPDPDSAPAWCGGIGADDIEHADTQAERINDVIRDTVEEARAESAALDRRYELVEAAGAFGSNALCPADSTEQLANGIDQTNFDAEVDRLLADPVVRPVLDNASDAYSDYWRCVRRVFLFCDPAESLDRFTTNVHGLLDVLQEEQETILANIVKPASSGESAGARFDRSRGLFHPNAAGIEVLACYVHNTLEFLGTWQCPNGEDDNGRMGLRARAAVAGPSSSRQPVDIDGPGDVVDVDYPGFRAGSVVRLSLRNRVLAELPVGSDGHLTAAVTLPEAPAGVQVLSFRGEGAGGSGLGHDLRVRYPGRPIGGDDFAAYVTGFEPRPAYVESTWTPEELEVRYLGRLLWTAPADSEGGLLVEVPVPWMWPADQPPEIEVRGTRSGVVRTVRLDAVPYVPALWATSGALSISGSDAMVGGLAHAETDVVLSGARAALTGGVEYVGALTVNGDPATLEPAARRVPAGSIPRTVRVAEFRPGGAESVAAGSAYRSVPESECVDGVWQPRAHQLAGVIHVPCAVRVSGTDLDVTVTIAAEDDITVAGSGLSLRSASGTGALFVTGGALSVSGRGAELVGSVHAPQGPATISGSEVSSWCGVTATSVTVSGARFSAAVDQRCLPD